MADFYLVSAGSTFSKATIASGNFTPLFNTDQPHTVSVPYDPTQSTSFYLGINTGLGFSNNRPNRDVFGWVQLSNSSTGMSIISSAMAYGEAGIIVGTLNTVPVPEADTSAMLLMGAGVMGFMARRRKNTQA